MDEHPAPAAGKARQAFGRPRGEPSASAEPRRTPANVKDALDKMAGKMGDRRRAQDEARRGGDPAE